MLSSVLITVEEESGKVAFEPWVLSLSAFFLFALSLSDFFSFSFALGAGGNAVGDK